MEYLHANNVVHGSLKSKNVLVNRHGEVKVVDYGFLPVKRFALAASASPHFDPASTCYMAPEALTGGPLSYKSDVYR